MRYTEQMEVFEKRKRSQITAILRHYPPQRQASAVLPLLTLAQEYCDGWLPVEAMDKVAHILDMPAIRVYEVASFHTMFHSRPVGRHHIRICTSLPCWLRGADDLVRQCCQYLKTDLGKTSVDRDFTLNECECLGACVNAPVVWIDKSYYEDVSPKDMEHLIEDLRRGKHPKAGPMNGRTASEPIGRRKKKSAPDQKKSQLGQDQSQRDQSKGDQDKGDKNKVESNA